jgi:serine/threonine protein kinase
MKNKILGKGSFGIVKLAFDSINLRKVAVKIIPVSRRTLVDDNSYFVSEETQDNIKMTKKYKIEKEIRIIKYLDHPHIVKYYDCLLINNSYHIYMEFVKYGTLYDYMVKKKKIDDGTVCDIFVQLISALEYCHGNLISHRDIKLENILVANFKDPVIVKLTDFGLANYVRINSLHSSFCGSPNYAAPEIFLKKLYNPMLTDIWSVGVCLYIMAYGIFPWDYKNIPQMMVTELKIPNYGIRNESFVELIKKMLEVNPRKRITLDEVKKSDWIKDKILPSYLKDTVPINDIDLKLVNKIVSLGFDKKEALYSISENIKSQSTAIYHLLLNRKIKEYDQDNNLTGIDSDNVLECKKVNNNRRSKTEFDLLKSKRKTFKDRITPIFSRKKKPT